MPKNSPWSHRHQRPGCAITLLAAAITLASLGHLFTESLLVAIVALYVGRLSLYRTVVGQEDELEGCRQHVDMADTAIDVLLPDVEEAAS